MAYDYEKERQEAVLAGERALGSLNKAKSCLESARGWGIYDILGGGFVSSLIKHGRMNKAEEYLSEAKSDLRRFEKELRDLDAFESINLNTQDFLGIADLIFDGLIADVAMQSRINDARAAVNRAIHRVEGILSRLQPGAG